MAAKIVFLIFLIFFAHQTKSNELIKILDNENNYVQLNIIDKITSRLIVEKINIKKLSKVKDFQIYIDKCILDSRKGFLETSIFIQIKDIKDKSKDTVYLFNNWMFSSNSSLNEVEHPNYDISLKSCN
tara:strand:+ start:12 stop:395 length:384 start_codon:yes stop_codon:yes gene_type:complete